NWKLAILSGVLAAIAIETKYNAITVLPVIAITSILYRSWRTGAIAIAVCLLLTISWETSVALRYGQCQFVAQLLINDPRRRIALMQVAGELPAYFAGVCPFLMILAVRAITRQAAILSLVAMILVAMTLLARPILFDAMTGALIVLSCIAVARWWREHTDLADRKMMLALLAWVAVEAAMGLALSPFPAVRRLFALMIPTTLLLARCAFQRRADTAGVSQSDWRFACAICLLLAMFYYAVDLEDAWVRKRSVEGAVATAKQSDPNAHVWVIGHWGAEYYGERAGASLLVPDQSILKRGDFIVAADGVHTQMVRLPRQTLEVVARPLTRFCVPWTASPAFYAGIAPLERRVPIDATTPSGLQPTILRVTQDCILPCDFTLAYLSELANRRRSMAPDGLIRALIGYCANGADREVKTAQDALVSIGPRAMLIALRNESPRVRYFAAGELARYAQVAEVSQALQRAAHDPDAAVREQAQRALNGQIH
ncbi:MAG TPA: hypothetical protein VL282_03720, partial [Tepidisphaeraceae bacterium]|nr:hypothetical protein [Tepidisphaeraceae bacterium]